MEIKKMNFKAIVYKIQEIIESEDFAEETDVSTDASKDSIWEFLVEYFKDYEPAKCLGEIVPLEDNFTSSDSCYSVYLFKDHDVYIKRCADYSSYEGRSYTDYEPQEVKPVQKSITVYE